MTKEEKAIYEYAKNDFVYCIQVLKNKANKTTIFPLLIKFPFDEIIKLKQEISNSLFCFNIISQQKRKSGLTTAFGFFIAYELYFKPEEKKYLVHLTDHTKHSTDAVECFLEYFEKIFRNDTIKIEKDNKKEDNVNCKYISGNKKVLYYREAAVTIHNLNTSLRETEKIEITYDNGDIKNYKKLESFLDCFYGDNFVCNVCLSAEFHYKTIKKYEGKHNKINYTNNTI